MEECNGVLQAVRGQGDEFQLSGEEKSEITAKQPAGMLAFPRIEYTTEQIQLIKNTYAIGATNDELSLFVYMAKKLGLDILTRQIHFVKRKRWNPRTNRSEEVAAYQIGIDGYVELAQRARDPSGKVLLDGFNTEVLVDDKKKVLGAKATIYRKDFGHPIELTVDFEEYCPKKDGRPMATWATHPKVMIEKCALALALRRTFPQFAGTYAPEEMEAVGEPTPAVDLKPEERAKVAKPVSPPVPTPTPTPPTSGYGTSPEMPPYKHEEQPVEGPAQGEIPLAIQPSSKPSYYEVKGFLHQHFGDKEITDITGPLTEKFGLGNRPHLEDLVDQFIKDGTLFSPKQGVMKLTHVKETVTPVKPPKVSMQFVKDYDGQFVTEGGGMIGPFKKGDVADLSQANAHDLITKGYAVEVVRKGEERKVEAPPKPTEWEPLKKDSEDQIQRTPDGMKILFNPPLPVPDDERADVMSSFMVEGGRYKQGLKQTQEKEQAAGREFKWEITQVWNTEKNRTEYTGIEVHGQVDADRWKHLKGNASWTAEILRKKAAEKEAEEAARKAAEQAQQPA